MHRNALRLGLAIGLAALGACNGNGDGNSSKGNANEASAGKDGASSKTIAAGLPQNSKFMTAAKAAGLDQTLAGPDNYTVLVPDDAAFDKLPAGSVDNLEKPEQRAQLTQILTYHILPGTVLVSDIGKAIDNSKGKAVLATMNGANLTATRDGGKIVLTDGKGQKAAIGQADEKYSNGAVHHIDTVLSPAQG
jgi:uncharacterized surface protein with fasciclin (FAS1) repeats